MQAERVNTVVNSAPLLAGGRFALVRAPDDGRRFVINDKGFAKVSDGEAGGILFQLSGKVAILCVPEVGPVPGRDHAWLCDEMTLTADAVFPWNDATWRHTGPYCVIGHPDDADSIGVLGDLAVVIPDVPFRDRSDSGMFDWAFEGSASSGLRGTAAP